MGIFEIHYDNPAHDTGVVDDFGFQLFWTSTLRQHDAGQLTLGDPTVSMEHWLGTPYESGNLPYGQPRIHRQATCPGECTQDFTAPIHVFAQFMHMHHFGEKIYSERYDSAGTYIGTPNRIDFWDNAFQPVHEKEPFQIQPGESIQTHCYFNTAGKSGNGNVNFGQGTADEMCMDFLFYYPAQYRGTSQAGKQVPFAFCGMRAMDPGIGSDLAMTVCGGINQQGNAAFMPQGQVARPDTHYADPLAFGTANLTGAGQAKRAPVCTVCGSTSDTTCAPTMAPDPMASPTAAPIVASGAARSAYFLALALLAASIGG